jgi:hypothetical protein
MAEHFPKGFQPNAGIADVIRQSRTLLSRCFWLNRLLSPQPTEHRNTLHPFCAHAGDGKKQSQAGI